MDPNVAKANLIRIERLFILVKQEIYLKLESKYFKFELSDEYAMMAASEKCNLSPVILGLSIRCTVYICVTLNMI